MKILSCEEIQEKLKTRNCQELARSMGGITGAYLAGIRRGDSLNPSRRMRIKITEWFNREGLQ